MQRVTWRSPPPGSGPCRRHARDKCFQSPQQQQGCPRTRTACLIHAWSYGNPSWLRELHGLPALTMLSLYRTSTTQVERDALKLALAALASYFR
jgi:hypothetical protein